MYRRSTDFYIFFLLGPYLVLTGNVQYSGLYAYKSFLFLYASCAYLLLILISAVVCRFKEKASDYAHTCQAPFCAAQLFAILFFFFSLLSALLSDYPQNAFLGGSRFFGLFMIAVYCLIFLSLTFFFEAQEWQLWAFGGAITYCCVIALLQHHGKNPLQLYASGQHFGYDYVGYSLPFMGTIGNIDFLGTVLGIAVAVCLSSLFFFRARRKWLLCIPLILSIRVLSFLHVSGAVVAILWTVLLCVPVLFGTSPRRRRRLVLLSVLISFAILLAVFFFGNALGQTAREASDILHGTIHDSYGSGRIYIWRNMLSLIREHLLFGGGPDTLFPRSASANILFSRYDVIRNVTVVSIVDNAHNEYLNIAVNEGLLALISYLCVIACALHSWIKQTNDPIASLCGCVLVFYTLQALFGIASHCTTPYALICTSSLCHVKQVKSSTQTKNACGDSQKLLEEV